MSEYTANIALQQTARQGWKIGAHALQPVKVHAVRRAGLFARVAQLIKGL